MARRLNCVEFVERAKEVHGQKYDYSKTNYVNSREKVLITCPIHGDFLQMPMDHLNGHGCSKCGQERKTKLVYGFGINDVREYDYKSYKCWWAMISRCYNKNNNRSKTYFDCRVCEEWKFLSKFKEWFDANYVDGWHLDKDILSKGNRVYSPQTCCFVPNEINVLFTKRQNCRGDYPIGVKIKGNRYESSIHINGESVYLGCYETIEQAFFVYKNAKEKRIKELADKWRNQLYPIVYEALYNYKVEITD